MRRVNREGVSVPVALTDPNGVGARERARASKHYAKPKNERTKKFTFSAYKEDDVKDALLKLFRNKCAYCEGLYTAGSSLDVEHFRPKREVEGDSSHPGYWWLASAWANLLPSCERCNRASYQRSATLGMTVDQLSATKKALSGKRSCFPIRGPVRATCESDDHDAEDPLLIDPTQRDPADHLSWHLVNNLSIVAPCRSEIGEDPYGAESVLAYGLNRQDLVEARSRLVLELQTAYVSLRSRIQLATKLSGELLDDYLQLIEIDLNNIAAYASPERPFSKCAENFIQSHIHPLLDELRQLRHTAQ